MLRVKRIRRSFRMAVEDVWEHVDFLESASSSNSSSSSSSSSGKNKSGKTSEEGREKIKMSRREEDGVAMEKPPVGGRWVVEPDFVVSTAAVLEFAGTRESVVEFRLNDTGLTIIKGDANYRRLLGKTFDHSKDAFEDVGHIFRRQWLRCEV